MLDTDYGFKSDAIVTMGGQFRDSAEKIRLLEQRFSRLPGIAQMVRANNSPAGFARQIRSMTFKGKTLMEFNPTTDFADERYIPFYGIRLLAGRNIRHSDSLAEFVINETGARQLGFAQPSAAIGQVLYYDDKPYPIVGVVADYHEASFRAMIGPAVIGHSPADENSLAVKLASTGKGVENVKATLEAMEKSYKEIFPHNAFRAPFMDDQIRDMYEEEQKTASLIRVAMGLAIVISCMGLFGLSLFTAERRAGEIGIRKVLGATTADIALMLNRQFIQLVLLALVIAAPVAWLLAHNWLQAFAYRITIDAWIFIGAGLGAAALALITVSYQTLRAALTNPVKSLKTE